MNTGYDILSQELTINSRYKLELDQDKLPTGQLIALKQTPFDFRQTKPIAACIDQLQMTTEKGIDDIYLINPSKHEPSASIRSATTGHQLKLFSDRNGLVVFTANSFTPDIPLKNYIAGLTLGLR